MQDHVMSIVSGEESEEEDEEVTEEQLDQAATPGEASLKKSPSGRAHPAPAPIPVEAPLLKHLRWRNGRLQQRASQITTAKLDAIGESLARTGSSYDRTSATVKEICFGLRLLSDDVNRIKRYSEATSGLLSCFQPFPEPPKEPYVLPALP
eukprot:g67673.t1